MKQFPIIASCITSFFFGGMLHAQTKVYTGKVGNHKIELHLLSTASAIYGYYLYDTFSYPRPLHTNGKKKQKLIAGDNEYFSIALNGKTAKGIWYNNNDSTKQPFSVTQTGVEKVDNTYSGEYGVIGNEYRQTISFHLINKEYAYFHAVLSQEGAYPCEGEETNIASMTAKSKWVCNDTFCKNFTIIFKNDGLNVDEGDCNNHGFHCTFNGDYPLR